MANRSRALIVVFFIALLAPSLLPAQGLSPYVPSKDELAANYKRAQDIGRATSTVYKLQLAPNWLQSGAKMWYVNRLSGGAFEYVLIDCASGKRSPLFDTKRLAEALSKETGKAEDSAKLDLGALSVADDLKTAKFRFGDKGYELTFIDFGLKPAEVATPRPSGGRGQRDNSGPISGQQRSNRSRDGKYEFAISEGRLKVSEIAGGKSVFESKTDQIAYANWAPDSRHLAVFRLLPGDHRQVSIIQSSPPSGGRAVLKTRNYDLPGDKLDTFETYVFDVSSGSELRSDLEPFFVYGLPWSEAPRVLWWREGKSFMVDFAERGYGAYRFEEIDLETAKHRTVIDERTDTFFDTTAMIANPIAESNEIIWRSERDGFGRLYLIDAASGAVKNAITPARWVVRQIDWVDEKTRKLCFAANCTEIDPKLDPYLVNWFIVGLDGNGLVRLTQGYGNHGVRFSPNREYYENTWSRVDSPPVHELHRSADGKKICELERADVSEWTKFNIKPEVFVAKGRDSFTDIWGVVCRPTTFDPKKKYPVIENLYAGPQDSFTPKTFSALSGMQRLAELGFIVVQCDGMGTRNRGKKFHDVCYKNLADAGFPDRILWMQALAAKYPQADISRVGVYGTSAGGQSSTGALLFHPEFYKVGVSSCGCHDNRMDKMWWNEQWMGAMGPHYEAQSNITNASKLQGHLMLFVGEMDTNVPPESTYRLVDALIKANKDFEFLVLPGSDHTGGGAYGEHKRRDFFVKWLLGVEPPTWSSLIGN